MIELTQRRHCFVLSDGSGVRVRPLLADDRARYLAAIDQLSPRTVQLRFGGPRGQLSAAEVDAFLDVGRDGREALVVTDAGDDRILAIGRFAPTALDATTAEVAVVVVDEWQGHGLGTILLAELVELATHTNYRTMHATSQLGNRPVAALLHRHGFHVTDISYGEVDWVLPLPLSYWSKT